MVYDSTIEAYKELMKCLPVLFESFGANDEYLSEDVLQEMEVHCRDTFFTGEMIPAYEKRDVINILKYYAQYESVPKFYTFDEVDRNKLDVAQIAKHIWDEDMGERKRAEYINSIWDSTDDNMLKLFFGRKLYFLKQLDIELMKISHPDIYDDISSNVKYDIKTLENMTLSEIREVNPVYEGELRNKTFEKAKNIDGVYQCACCGFTDKTKVFFQVDHIIPMNKGGKTVLDNLQILCRRCNGLKSDK